MIQSRSIDWTRGTSRRFVRQYGLPWSLSSTGKQGTVYFSVDAMTSADSGNLRRAPGDFLLQGGTFDKYGNKSVSNVQWNIVVGQDNWRQLNPANSEIYFVERPYSSDYYCQLSDVYPVQTTKGTVAVADEYAEWAACGGERSTYWGYYARHVLVSLVPGPKDSDYEGKFAVITRSTYKRAWRYNGQYYLLDESTITAAGSANSSPFTGTRLWLRQQQIAEPVDAATWDAYNVLSTAALRAVSLELPSWEHADLSLIPASAWRSPEELTQNVANCAAFNVSAIPDHVIETWQREFMSYLPAVEHHFDEAEKSDVAQSIMNSINLFDGNVIAYAKDLSSFGDTLKSAVSLIGDYKNPKKWASAWLSGRYGDRLSIADTADAITAIRRDIRNMAKELILYRSTRSSSDAGTIVGIPYTTESSITGTIGLSGGLLGDLENALAAPYRWDFGLTLGNVWDMIPFSFVVNWIVDIGAILEQIDLMRETRLIDIKTQYASTKYVTSMSLTALTDGEYTGSIERVSYTRSPEKVDTWLRLKTFQGNFLTSARPVNFIDSAGLLVQSLN